MRSLDAILTDIQTFLPEEGDWRPLDILLGELWKAGVREEHLPVLLSLFERFPAEDGAGVLWGVVHGIEALPFDYLDALRASMNRRASSMGSLMMRRALAGS